MITYIRTHLAQLRAALRKLDVWPDAPLLLMAPFLLALCLHLSLPPDPGFPPSGNDLYDWVAEIPTRSGFYFLLATFVDIYAIRSLLRRKRFLDDLNTGANNRTDGSPLTTQEWRAIRGIQQRAFSFRERGDATLVGAIVLLIGSLYVLTFFVPYIRITDLGALQVATFSERFGAHLNSLRDGRSWLRTLRTGSEITTAALSANGVHGIVASADGLVYVTVDGATSWGAVNGLDLNRERLPVAAAWVGDDGSRLAVGADASVFRSDDGATWRRLSGLPLGRSESIARSWVSANGPQAIAGTEGTLLVATDGGWNVLEFDLQDRVTALEFDANGIHGVLGTSDGAVYASADSGATWRRLPDVGLDVTEWLIRAWFSDDGPNALLGDEGTVLVRTDEGWNSLALEFDAPVTTLEFSGDGTRGVLGTSDGLLYEYEAQNRTSDWTRLEVSGFSASEWARRTWVTDEGPRAILGAEGTVLIRTAGSWSGLDLELDGRVTVLEFSEDGSRGVVGSSGGSLYEYAPRDDVSDWAPLEVPGFNGERERLAEAWVAAEGLRMMVGDQGTVLIRTGNGWDRAPWRARSFGFRFPAMSTVGPLTTGGNHALLETDSRAVVVTDDGGRTWRLIRLQSEIGMVEFSATGNHGAIGGLDGSVYVTTNGGEDWTWLSGLGWNAEERAAIAWMGADGPRLIVGTEGTILTSNATEWTEDRLELQGQVTLLELNPDGTQGLIGTSDGRLWERTVGRQDWREVGGFRPQPGESLEAAWLADNSRWIVAGSRGSLLVSVSPGEWELQQSNIAEVEGARFAEIAHGVLDGHDVGLAYDGVGTVYLLRSFPNMDLVDVPREEVRERVAALPTFSELRGDMEAFLNIPISTNPADENVQPSDDYRSFGLDQTDWIRITLMAAMSYLVQLLIRQYQYYVRLASFLDSRADAVVLAGRFEKIDFDRLVVALGPDAYDFRAVKGVTGPGILGRLAGSTSEHARRT